MFYDKNHFCFQFLTYIKYYIVFTDSIQQGSFLSQKYLTAIDLSSNRVNNIEIGAFEGLSVLKQLLLSENRLSKFNSDIFYGNINIKKKDFIILSNFFFKF